VLSAAEQFAKVQELLSTQDPSEWPAYGHLLALRGFADQVRQFLSRAQEALLTPESIAEAAGAHGLTGWHELARFFGEYLEVLDGLNVVDFAGMVARAGLAAAGDDPLADHLLIDDLQDTTLAAERLFTAVRAADTVAAGDAAAHLFSFQGTTAVPFERFAETFPNATTIPLGTDHRAGGERTETAWLAVHTSEAHAAIARELRRAHVEDGVPWADLAVIVRRQGAHVGGLLRALDDAKVPRTVPERGVSLAAEPATFPYVLALRWIVLGREGREQWVESVLTSDLVGLSPAAARGVLREARTAHGSTAEAFAVTEGLSPAEATTLTAVGEVLEAAGAKRGSVIDAFEVLWRRLPVSARLVAEAETDPEARRRLDAVVAFAGAVAEAGATADPTVEAFLGSLDAGDRGPGYSVWERTRPDAVGVLTAHGATGLEFDTVIVADAVEGNFPSLGRAEPMFDLAALRGPIPRSREIRERLADERRLFDNVIARARRRAIVTAPEAHGDDAPAPSRFVEDRGLAWEPAPDAPFAQPVSVREATGLWRRTLADPTTDAPLRAAASEGLDALGADRSRWWFQREWTDTGQPLHDHLRVSFSKLNVLENCELQYVLAAELGLGRPVGFHAWVGKTVHSIVEDCENGQVERDLPALQAEVDRRWRPEEFPSKAVGEAWRALAKDRMLANWFGRYGTKPAIRSEGYFTFDYDGATLVGYIDRIGPDSSDSAHAHGNRITDFKTGQAPPQQQAATSLQLGIYYLAVLESEELQEFQPIAGVELAYLKGHWKAPHGIEIREWEVGSGEREQRYQTDLRERLSHLIAELKRLIAEERYRPNPNADCWFCEFKSLCPLWPEGTPLFDVETVRAGAGERP
jgi:superfamily I DNA/RNA helicase/RecB family exonuclease